MPKTLALARSRKQAVAPQDWVDRHIYLIRGEKVMLDTELATLYCVETRTLIQAVKRNLHRFPADFMFQLTAKEAASLSPILRSQSVISSSSHGGRRYRPFVFTEHGVAMLSSVLKTKRAIQMNILIVRAFIRMRDLLTQHKELADRITQLEATQDKHASVITILAEEIERLSLPPAPPKRRIGFPARSIATAS